MIKIFKQAAEILKDNVIIIQPLIIFWLIAGLVMDPFVQGQQTLQTNKGLFTLLTVFLLSSAFLAGWYYIIKLAVVRKNQAYKTPEEKALASISLLKEFFTGVGEFCIPMLLSIILYIVILFITVFVIYKIGVHYIGHLDLNDKTLKALYSPISATDIQTAKDGLIIPAQTVFYLKWLLLFSIGHYVFSFLSLFFGAVIVCDTKNPLKALYLNISFIVKNFLGAMAVFLFLAFLNLVLFFINIIFAQNMLLSILSLALFLFYVSYYMVLVFLYYDEKKENHCDSGSECLGQN